MDEPNLTRLTIYYALGIGGTLTLLGVLLRKPLERISVRLGGDPEKGLKAVFIAFLVFYVIVAVAMSLFIAWRIMHGAGPFGIPLPTPTPTPVP